MASTDIALHIQMSTVLLQMCLSILLFFYVKTTKLINGIFCMLLPGLITLDVYAITMGQLNCRSVVALIKCVPEVVF
jgi:hypothetical protein